MAERFLDGLCPHCRYVMFKQNDRGSAFLLCTRSAGDPRYPKFPPQPVARCDGYQLRLPDGDRE